MKNENIVFSVGDEIIYKQSGDMSGISRNYLNKTGIVTRITHGKVFIRLDNPTDGVHHGEYSPTIEWIRHLTKLERALK